jgi:lipopolysaccharide transport system ATP-binding protein
MSVIRNKPDSPREADNPVSERISSEIALRVSGLSKSYRIGKQTEKYKTLRDTIAGIATAPLRRLRSARAAHSNADETIWALRDVSFEVRRGEVVGVIGRNGAGKSTLLKVLSRITEPTRGRAEIHGRVGSLLEVGTGFHPELTGRENIFLNGAILGMRRAEIRSKFDEIVSFSEISRFVDTAVKFYSSGMYLRLAFAVAAHLEPEILLVDEVLAVGDVLFQQKCIGKMEDVARVGRTVVFVSHNMAAVRSLCRTGLLLNEGRIEYSGDVGRCIEMYYEVLGAFQGSSEAAARGSSGGPFGSVVINRGDRSIDQSKPFEARTTLRIEEDTVGFSLFCLVQDMLGRSILHLREESPSFGLTSIARGSYEISVLIPPLWLNPGLYSLQFKAINWAGAREARFVSDAVPLDVTGSASRSNAVLHPAATWNVTEARWAGETGVADNSAI